MTKKLGLALGSGSDRGFAHIGVLKALKENEIEINCVSGSSMGAVIAAYYALHQETIQLEQLAVDWPNINWLSLIDLNSPTVSLIKGEKIRQFLIDNLYGTAKFSDTQIPLKIVATTLENGKKFVFESGLLVDAVMASSSIPGIFPPFEFQGVHLIDGGLAEAVPLELVDNAGAEVRLGVDLYSYTQAYDEKYDMRNVQIRAYRLYMARLSALEKYHNDPRTIIIRPQTNEGLEALTFTHAKQNILAGYLAATTAMSAIKDLVAIV